MTSYKILVADDEVGWTELLNAELSTGPYEVVTAPSGGSFLELAGSISPDLAIVDLHLPDMSGQEVCEKLRRLPGLERIPIIALSAYRTEKIQSLNLGADAFVSKNAGGEEIQASASRYGHPR